MFDVSIKPGAGHLAEPHRQHLERWFHDCDHTTHRELVTVIRNDVAPACPSTFTDAIIANADRATR